MSKHKQRLEFLCYNCNEPFSLQIELDPSGSGRDLLLASQCLHCGVEVEIDLNPYRSPVDTVTRGEPATPAPPTQTFTFPTEEIPTQPPTKSQPPAPSPQEP